MPSSGRGSGSGGRWTARRRGSSRARFAARGRWPRRRARWPRADRSRAGARAAAGARGALPTPRARRRSPTLDRAGLVDDARLAESRAELLARRGYGDAAIRADLRRRLIAPEAAADAVASLEPELERLRRVLEGAERHAGTSAAARRARLLTRHAGRGRARRLRRRRETRYDQRTFHSTFCLQKQLFRNRIR